MPTYEYACDACGHKFEEFQSITAKPTVKCPKCGKRKVKRLISAGAGFIFKGSGFYITDYRSDKYKADAKDDSTPSKTEGAAAKGDGKGDSAGKSDSGTKTESAKTEAAPAKAESKAPVKAESKPAAPAKGSKK